MSMLLVSSRVAYHAAIWLLAKLGLALTYKDNFARLSGNVPLYHYRRKSELFIFLSCKTEK